VLTKRHILLSNFQTCCYKQSTSGIFGQKLQTSPNNSEIVAFFSLITLFTTTRPPPLNLLNLLFYFTTGKTTKINMFGKVNDDSFTHIFDISLEEDSRLGFQSSYGNNHKQMASNSSSPMSSRRDFSSSPSTPSSSSSLPLEAAFSQFAASFSNLLADKESAASAAISLDKKISELERLRNKINNSDSHSSASSTTSSSSTSTAASKVNTSRYKTELCRPFSEHGTCKYGEKCQFAHGGPELRNVSRHPKYKTDLCRTYHSAGFCPYGPRCHFIHNLDELAAEQEKINQGSNQGSQQAQQQQQPQQQQQQQQQQPSSFSHSSNKVIGSGRIISANKLPEDHQQKIRPLPMFDTRNNNNQQQSQRGNNLFPQTPSGWNPLNSININVNDDSQKVARLPVFSTLALK